MGSQHSTSEGARFTMVPMPAGFLIQLSYHTLMIGDPRKPEWETRKGPLEGKTFGNDAYGNLGMLLLEQERKARPRKEASSG